MGSKWLRRGGAGAWRQGEVEEEMAHLRRGAASQLFGRAHWEWDLNWRWRSHCGGGRVLSLTLGLTHFPKTKQVTEAESPHSET